MEGGEGAESEGTQQPSKREQSYVCHKGGVLWDIFLPLPFSKLPRDRKHVLLDNSQENQRLCRLRTILTLELEDFADFEEIFVSKLTSRKPSVFQERAFIWVRNREASDFLLFQNSEEKKFPKERTNFITNVLRTIYGRETIFGEFSVKKRKSGKRLQ